MFYFFTVKSSVYTLRSAYIYTKHFLDFLDEVGNTSAVAVWTASSLLFSSRRSSRIERRREMRERAKSGARAKIARGGRGEGEKEKEKWRL